MLDYKAAQFLVSCGDAVAYVDLQLFWLGEDDSGVNSIDFMNNDVDWFYSAGLALLQNNHATHLTPTTKRLHDKLSQSVAEDEEEFLSEEQKSDAWKSVKEMIDYVLNDKSCRKRDKNKFLAAVRDDN